MQEFIAEIFTFCLDRIVEHILKIFSFRTTASEMNPVSYPVPGKSQETSNQRGDDGKVEKLSTQVRISYRIGFVI
jgi:hypothetical protein